MVTAAMVSAAAPGQSQAGERIDQYLAFELAGQYYGIDILRVQEIKGWEKPTRLPHSPDYVQGVINLRGAVVPIIDLRRRFGLADGDHGRTTVVIVVRVPAAGGEAHAELTAGLVVDAVCEVCSLASGELRPPPQAVDALDTTLVRGLAVAGERMLILLDVPRLMSSTLAEHGAAASHAA
ncbi:MAG TPA: chemotaxis protein CheW [Steroidobacteraceae bacterium]|nr:chemotaxis protein CheW [Steroidobacteraceae bacterium]